MRRCANPGCEQPVPRAGAIFCSEQCRQSVREQRNDENYIRRIFEQAELAPRPETCRQCPGAYTYLDERGECWCMCGRDATLVVNDLRRIA